MAGSSSGGDQLSAVLTLVATLYDKTLFSDMVVVVGSRSIHAHRIVLAARGKWTAADGPAIEAISELRLTNIE